jgi:formate dehydrogenase subunit gamma
LALRQEADETTRRAQDVIARFSALEGPLLPILHGIQEEFGFVPAETLPVVAEALNISRAEIHGVASFYHDYRAQPAGKHVLKLCRAEACQAMGAEKIAAQVQAALGIGFGQTARDNSVTLEPVFCLGLCATAPAAMLDGRVIGRLTPERAEKLVGEVAA